MKAYQKIKIKNYFNLFLFKMHQKERIYNFEQDYFPDNPNIYNDDHKRVWKS